LSTDTLATIATAIAAAINADTNLQTIGVTATAASTVLNVKSASLNATTYSTLKSSGATETLTLAPGASVTGDSFNTVNQLVARSASGTVAFAGQTNKPIKSASVQASTITFIGPQDFKLNTYTPSTSVGYGANFSINGNFSSTPSTKGNVVFQYYFTGGSGPAAGIQWSMTVANPELSGGQETVTYTETAADTMTTIGTGIANAISSDPLLKGIGISATSSYDSPTATYNVTIAQAIPTYTVATNTGATETVVLGQSATPNSTLVVGGTITAGDTISLTAHYPSLPSGLKTVTYTVLSTDTVKSVATGLTALFNADTNIQSLDLTSTNLVAAMLNTSETFSANPILAAPQINASVSVVDGGNNTKTNSYQVGSKGALAQNLSYDLNGNLLNDGINTYQWDIENRLIQINYPGSSTRGCLRE
jgi:hypothetical protein